MSGGELDTAERQAIVLLLQAAHGALLDQRLTDDSIWFVCGALAERLRVAALDIERGGRALLLLGAAIAVAEDVDQVTSGRPEPPRTGGDDGNDDDEPPAGR